MTTTRTLAGRPRPLTPRQRAAVRQALASAVGAGRHTTRAALVDELFAVPAASESITVEVLAGPAPLPVEPITVDVIDSPAVVVPDTTPDSPTAAPDAVVTVADAAARLKVTEKTVKRYLSPSSGKLRRFADGVSRASVDALAATR